MCQLDDPIFRGVFNLTTQKCAAKYWKAGSKCMRCRAPATAEEEAQEAAHDTDD